MLITLGGKAAFANLKEKRVDHLVSVGRGGVLLGKLLKDAAISGLWGGMYSLATRPEFASLGYSPNSVLIRGGKIGQLLTGGPGSKFAYVLNVSSEDVTIINTEDGTVSAKIPVGGSEGVLVLPAEGRFLCAYSKRKLVFLDTQTQKVRLEYKLPSGEFRGVRLDAQERRILALTEDSVLVWDDETGQLLPPIAGLSKPSAIAFSRP